MEITPATVKFYNNTTKLHQKYMQNPVSFGDYECGFEPEKTDNIQETKKYDRNRLTDFCNYIFKGKEKTEIYNLKKEVCNLADKRNKNCPDDVIDIEEVLSDISDDNPREDLSFLKEIIYLKGNSQQLTSSEINCLLVDLSEEQRERLIKYKLLYDVAGRKKQLHLLDAAELVHSDDYIIERIQKMNLLGKIEGRKSDLTIGDAIYIAKFDDEMCRQILESGILADIDGRENPLTGKEVANFHSFLLSHNHGKKSSKQSEDLILMFHKAKERGLFSDKFGSNAYLDMSRAAKLAKLSEQNFANIKNSGILKFHQNLMTGTVEFLASNSNNTQFLKNAVTFLDLFEESTVLDFQNISELNEDDFTNFVNFTRKNNLNRRFSPDVCIAAAKSGDEGMGAALNKVYDAAFAHHNQLVNAVDNITDDDIVRLLNHSSIVATIYLLGANAFIHSFSMKYYAVEDLLERVNKYIIDYAKVPEQELLREKLSSKTIPPEDKIQRLSTIAAIDDPIEREILINKIHPNMPDKYMIDMAKSIWAEHGKTFDEKYETFCRTFELDNENSKIKKFFESRATINSKGYKILNNISSKDIAQLLAVEVVKPQNDAEWNKTVNEYVFRKFDVYGDEEFNKKVDFSNNKYIYTIPFATNEAVETIKELFHIIQKNPDKTVNETLDALPQNIETCRLFKQYGINYKNWTEAPKKEDEVYVKIKTDAVAAKRAAISNLEKDLTDPLMDDLPEEETEKIFKALKEIGVTVKDYEHSEYDGTGLLETTTITKKLTRNDKAIVFDDLPEIISAIKKVINENKFWTNPNENEKIDAARITMYNHLMKLRDTEIKTAANLQSERISDIHVRKADMNDIAYSLFLGNYASCCTAIGSSIGNDFAAPRYIMDKFISAIEVLDDKTPVGNTMCYFANVDGKLALVLDNIELQTKYQNNDGIRDAIIKAAENICKSVGKPELPIYAGPYRHKVDLSEYELKERQMQIIGASGGNLTYLDYLGSIAATPYITYTPELYKLK